MLRVSNKILLVVCGASTMQFAWANFSQYRSPHMTEAEPTWIWYCVGWCQLNMIPYLSLFKIILMIYDTTWDANPLANPKFRIWHGEKLYPTPKLIALKKKKKVREYWLKPAGVMCRHDIIVLYHCFVRLSDAILANKLCRVPRLIGVHNLEHFFNIWAFLVSPSSTERAYGKRD